MKVRQALLASVCTAFLAATAAASGAAAAQPTPIERVSEGYRLLAAGKAADAVTIYSEAIESRSLPTDVLAGALLNRGLAHQQLGEHRVAIDDYTAALRIDALGPKLRATALYNRGLAYQQISRPALAIEDFTGALLLDAEFAHAYYSRGNALRDSGQLLFALSDYEKAVKFNHPQIHAVHYSEGVTLAALKRTDEAHQSLMKALAAKPDYEAARKKLTELGFAAPEPLPSVAPAVAEAVVTGSTSKLEAGQVVQKTYLPPAAVLPPPKLLAAEVVATKRKKLYTDRVPEAAPESAPAPRVAATSPAADENVVAIEAVPEETDNVAPPTEELAASTEADASSEPAESAPAAAEATPMTGWAVQLSSQRDEKVAWNVWGKMKAKHKILADQQPVVVKADLGTRGVFYRLRLAGFDSQGEAKTLCSKLKSRRVSCFVSKLEG